MAGLLLAALLAYSQVFSKQDFFGPGLLGLGAATAAAMLARRRGLGAPLTCALSGVLALWYLAVVFRPSDILYGLPTPAALGGLASFVGRAVAASQFDFAPVPVRPGYVILLTAGMWAAATLGELASFRWRRPLLASAPALALFSVAFVVGTRTLAPFWVTLFLSALLIYWGLESSHGLRSWGRWVPGWSGSEDEGPSPVTAALARRMGVSTVAAALVAPVFFPLFGSELFTWRTGEGGRIIGAGQGTPTGLIDPFVSVRPRITDQTELELFTVRAERPTYWRLMSLENFNGESWQPRAYRGYDVRSGGFAPFEILTSPASQELTQTFTISGLRGKYLPGAVQAVGMPTGSPVYDTTRIDPSSGFMQTTDDLTEGLTYSVTSRVPDVAYRDLRTAEVGAADEALTSLPEDLPRKISVIAENWTRGAATRVDELLAIQQRLREFDYTLEVEPSASGDYLTQFLTKSKRGYCQQFSTAFAVLARARGFPARVSVGFLPGSPSPEDENLFTVRGIDAHAWPEVFFEDLGWVAFEPTPRDDGESEPPPYSEPPATAGGSRGPGAAFPGSGALRPNNRFESFRGNPLLGPAGPVPDGNDRAADGNFRWEETFARISVAALVLALIFLVTVPTLKLWRVRRRYLRSKRPVDVAEAAFAEFQDDAGELAWSRGAAESAVAYVRGMAAHRRVPPVPAARLASIYEAAEYGRGGIAQVEADEARELAGELKKRLWASASWWDRIVRLFSVRGLTAQW